MYPDVTQRWYAGNSEALGVFDNFGRYLNVLKRNGPALGYYPEPTKIILIGHPNNIKMGKLFCAR